MDNNEKLSSHDLNTNRLKEIAEREKELKREKSMLLRDKPWYTKASNWIAIFAIIISATLSIYTLNRTDKKKQLTVSYSKTSSLFTNISRNEYSFQLLYDSLTIENLSKLSVRMTNTGEKSISSDDFKDGPIRVIFSNDDIDKNETIPTIIDIVTKQRANQTNDKIIYDNKLNSSFEYLPSLLNKGESIELEIYLSCTSTSVSNIIGKITDGELINTGLSSNEKNQNENLSFNTIFKSFSNAVGSKTLSVIILIILSITAIIYLVLELPLVGFDDKEDTVISISAMTIGLFPILLLFLQLIYG
ncbi:hypothetical protein [Labilibaculum antarcticum]|uniref:Uncharacterized protein n=1 Tax=Labilibaculum antarcticum TaxID=1717717 RepID=A0A1Y1CGX9_9BACT|nr:hypothetical protein [Labilibaculum antarcticum]BAX79343.1 hypothetical protein ALGA_0956 [Labilibaculum antarcticum]